MRSNPVAAALCAPLPLATVSLVVLPSVVDAQTIEVEPRYV